MQTYHSRLLLWMLSALLFLPTAPYSRGAGVDYAATIQPIYTARCIGCHGLNGSGGLDLRIGSSYGNTVNRFSAGSGVGQSGKYRVRQNSASLSFANTIIQGTQGNTPPVHPFVGTAAAEKTQFADWINQGALPNTNPPTLSGVSPTSGALGGGTPVTITGTGFGGSGAFVPVVTFGGVAATNVVVVPSNSPGVLSSQITCTTPARAAGPANVVVTTSAGGTSAPFVNGFIFTGPPTVTSPTSTSVTANSAILGGNVTSDGGAPITARGIVYSVTATNNNPQLGGTGVTALPASGTTGVFAVNATALSAATAYSFKAYATNSAGTTYTTPVSNFTTSASAPAVSAPTNSAITANSATLGGNVTSDGGAPITARGIVYSITATNANPQLGGAGVTALPVSGTTGAFTVNATGLAAATAYSFKAYATNSAGTAYTTSVSSFTTIPVAPTAPNIGGASFGNVTTTGATLGGNVTSDGGAPITARGVVYSVSATNNNPQLGGNGVTVLPAAGTVGAFTVNATGLTAATAYSFKAYATNSVGTTYTTPTSSFNTNPVAPIAPTIGSAVSSNIAANSATLGANVTSDGGAAVTARGVVYSVTANNSNPQLGGAGVTALSASGTTGVFSVTASGLAAATGYSFRGYATNSIGTTYTSPVSSFTTAATTPTVAAPSVNSITASSATLGGNVTSDGGAPVTARGVVYAPSATNSDPQIGGTGVTILLASGTVGIFTVDATGLDASTPYSFRAYATNSIGTTYTTPVTAFTTADIPTAAPTIGEPSSAGITDNSAILGGTVTSDGGASISPRGVVYSISAVNSDPQIGGTGVTTLSASGTIGTFTVEALGLDAGTEYSFRAFATNSVGTTYTTPVASFTTPDGDLPSNDDFAAAQLLPGDSGTVSSTNDNATQQAGEPRHAQRTVRNSVWFRWIAPSTGTITFDTFGSDFDTVLATYTGPTLDGLTEADSNDDTSGKQSRLSFDAVAGVTYFIAVDGFSGDTGGIVLNYHRGAVPVRGTYFGLIQSSSLESLGYSHVNSGFIKLTLTETAKFTGSLVYAGQSVTIRGTFGDDVEINGTILIPQLGRISLKLLGEIDRITGTIEAEGGATALIQANRNVYDKSRSPAPDAGKYTLFTQPTAPFVGQAEIPQGFGSGKLSIESGGTARVAGKLGDGTKFSVGSGLSKSRTLPIYAAIYKKLGSIQGLVALQSIENKSDGSGISHWFKPILTADSFYPGGFNTELNVLASRYVAPRRDRVLPLADSADNLRVTFSGGAMTAIPPFNVTLDRRNHVTGNGGIGLKITVSPKSGTFKGSFLDSSSSSRRTFSGSIFQKQAIGNGFFKGAGQTGSILLEPASAVIPLEYPVLESSSEFPR